MKKSNYDYVEAVATWSSWVAAIAFSVFVCSSAFWAPHILVGIIGGAALMLIPPYIYIKLKG